MIHVIASDIQSQRAGILEGQLSGPAARKTRQVGKSAQAAAAAGFI